MLPETVESTGLVDAIERRIALLEDERMIIDTLHRYGQAIDEGNAQAWAGLFTEDGVFLCLDRDGDLILCQQGFAALAQWVRDFKATETHRLKHVVMAPVVNLAGNRAEVTSYYANLIENEDPLLPPRIRFIGRYDDDMVREEDGQWRFRQRVSHTEAPLLPPRSET